MLTNPNPTRTAPVDSTRRGLLASLLTTRTVHLPTETVTYWQTDGTTLKGSAHWSAQQARHAVRCGR